MGIVESELLFSVLSLAPSLSIDLQIPLIGEVSCTYAAHAAAEEMRKGVVGCVDCFVCNVAECR